MPPMAPPTPSPRPVPGRIGAVLNVLAAIIAYARSFAATAADRAHVPEFASVAAVFGTYELPVILHRVQRGLLHALALREYLLARAARGRNLRFAWPNRANLQPHHRPPVGPPPSPRPVPCAKTPPDPALLGFDDPGAFRLPTVDELAASVRRRPVGRSMAYICLDLGIVPCRCAGEFWNQVEKVLRRYGGSLNRLYQVRARREEAFLRERDTRPDTWDFDWRYIPRPALRLALGPLIGETPMAEASPCLPIIAPS